MLLLQYMYIAFVSLESYVIEAAIEDSSVSITMEITGYSNIPGSIGDTN